MSRSPWIALVAVQFGLFIVVLDGTVVNVAIPAFISRFGTDLAVVEWIILAYRAALVAVLLPAGRLADLAGRKTIFMAGLAIFTAGSLACALAPDILSLALARAFQGIGAGLVAANAAGMVTRLFPDTGRGRALGINAAILAGATVVGPTLGGLLTDGLGPSSIFLINLPIGLVGLLVAWFVLDRQVLDAGSRPGTLDVPGAVSLAGALVLLFAAMDPPAGVGLPRPVTSLVLLASGILLLGAFAWFDQRAASPLVDTAVLRIPAIRTGALVLVLAAIAYSGTLLTMPIYLEDIRGLSATTTGAFLLSMSAGIGLLGPVGGTLADHFGSRRLVLTGLVLITMALALLTITGTTTPLPVLVVPLVLLGIGAGLFSPANTSAIMGASPAAAVGVVGALLALGQQIGLTVGNELPAAFLDGTRQNPDRFVLTASILYALSAAGALVALLLAWRTPSPPRQVHASPGQAASG